jgi:hypothetical protein
MIGGKMVGIELAFMIADIKRISNVFGGSKPAICWRYISI